MENHNLADLIQECEQYFEPGDKEMESGRSSLMSGVINKEGVSLAFGREVDSAMNSPEKDQLAVLL